MVNTRKICREDKKHRRPLALRSSRRRRRRCRCRRAGPSSTPAALRVAH